jgi:heme exporter protein A
MNSQATKPAARVAIENLSMAFETRRVLDKINLNIPPAQALCLCGINGAGKSTLLRIIAGLLHPTDGTVNVDGLSVKKHPEATKAAIGVISHQSMLYPDLTVAENLLFTARLYGVPKRKERVQALLEDVKLAPYRHDRTAILSRGMLQRLAIARAIVHQPKILLADEPFTGLDLTSGRHLVNILQNFTKAGGSVIMTTHEINFGLECCQRLVVLDKGRLIFDADRDKIDRQRFAHDYLTYAREAS